MEEQTHGSNFKVPPQDHLFTTPSRTEPSTFPLKKLPPELSAKLTTFLYPVHLGALARCSKELHRQYMPYLYRSLNISLLYFPVHVSQFPRLLPESLLWTPDNILKNVRHLTMARRRRDIYYEYPSARLRKDTRAVTEAQAALLVERMPKNMLFSPSWSTVAAPFFYRRVLESQSCLISISMSFNTWKRLEIPSMDDFNGTLPNLCRIRLQNISQKSGIKRAGQILSLSNRLLEVELSYTMSLSVAEDEDAQVHQETYDWIFSEFAKHTPEKIALELINLDGLPSSFFSGEHLHSLTLRRCSNIDFDLLGDQEFELRSLHLLVDSENLQFVTDVLARTKADALKTLVILVELDTMENFQKARSEVDSYLPIPASLITRHSNSLEHLAIHERYLKLLSPVDCLFEGPDEITDLFRSLVNLKEASLASPYRIETTCNRMSRVAHIDLSFFGGREFPLQAIARLEKLYLCPCNASCRVFATPATFKTISDSCIKGQLESCIAERAKELTQKPRLKYVIIGVPNEPIVEFPMSWCFHITWNMSPLARSRSFYTPALTLMTKENEFPLLDDDFVLYDVAFSVDPPVDSDEEVDEENDERGA